VNISPFATLAFVAASPALATSALAFDLNLLGGAETPPTLTGAGDLLWLWAKVIVFLAFLGSGALLLNHFYKRKRLGVKVNATGKIHLADTCALGNRQFLVVAEFEKERHLLGVSQNAINHLSQLKDSNAAEDDFEKALGSAQKSSDHTGGGNH
jgi:flagellar biogenesis protein FliO